METTKKLKFFFWFLAFETRKNKNNLGKTPTKKNNLLSQTNDSPQSFFFVFFGFPGIPKTSGFVFFLFFQGFCGLGDSRDI